MPLFLLIVGALLVLLGMGSIAAGAPDWVLGLSLGATLIQSGTIAFVGGLIMIALGMVLIVLQDLLKRLDAAASANAGRMPVAASEMRPAAPAAAPPPQPAPEAAPRREQPPETDAENFSPHPHGLDPDNAPPRPRRERAREQPGDEARRPRRPGLPAPPAEDQLRSGREVDAPSFSDDEPSRQRTGFTSRRREETLPPRRDPAPIPVVPQPFGSEGRRRPPESAQESPDFNQPKFGSAESAAPANAPTDTVVRSGVIGGMAYTLYADGSIEAELGIGTVRFNSIADLQEHVSRTGADPEVKFDGTKR